MYALHIALALAFVSTVAILPMAASAEIPKPTDFPPCAPIAQPEHPRVGVGCGITRCYVHPGNDEIVYCVF